MEIRAPSLLVNLTHLSRDTEHDAAAQGHMIPIKTKSHEVQRLLVQPADLPISFEAQAVLSELGLNLPTHPVQLALAPAKHNHIVHVSQIMSSAEVLLDPMIHIGQIEIGKHLRQQHPDGQAVALAQDSDDEGHEPFVLEFTPELFNELVNRDAGIELGDVHLQVILRILVIVPDPFGHKTLAVMHATIRD